jgi:two-component system, NtrC family, sensor histidine kinase HydH
VLVALLFLGSLGTLLASSALALLGSGEELKMRERLNTARGDLTEAAQELLPDLSADIPEPVLPEPANQRFADAAKRVLTKYPGTDGGFYLARSNQFAGFAQAVHPELQGASRKEPAKNGAAAARDPPPLERQIILQQIRECLARPDVESPVEVHDVGPSRVAIAVSPVGEERPARLAVWVMVRLLSPEHQRIMLVRLRLATAVSLGGVLLALGLAAWLSASLRGEQRQRERLRDELRQSEHLASLGRLLAGVAHEVRTPLAGIRSTVQLWERLPDQARTRESLTAVVGAVDRINELIGRLLLFARSGHEPRRRADLNAIVEETFELLRAQADAQGVIFRADLAHELAPVLAASQALRQVVLNLATNALQAMPSGGQLVCRTQVAPANRVELLVSDTGPGVPTEACSRLFEPFYTTRADGTGLGLALCREIARQHGGDVCFDRDAGPGATFRLTLPAASNETSAAEGNP